jgi:hypothetical protein
VLFQDVVGGSAGAELLANVTPAPDRKKRERNEIAWGGHRHLVTAGSVTTTLSASMQSPTRRQLYYGRADAYVKETTASSFSSLLLAVALKMLRSCMAFSGTWLAPVCWLSRRNCLARGESESL